ncbi:MAG: glycosyltransferase family 2 protein [Acidimicrobiia bacterium]
MTVLDLRLVDPDRLDPRTTSPLPAPAPDPRLAPPTWDPAPPTRPQRVRARLVASVGVVTVTAYLIWLLRPSRVGHPVLFAVLVAAELFNVAQAMGFWWTCALRPSRRRGTTATDPAEPTAAVDVFIPTYDEPVEIVEPTVAAAVRLHGVDVRVALLDDGDRAEMRALAERHGARYVRRDEHTGAKAGNINHALTLTSAPFVLVLDCDHVPDPDFLVHALAAFDDGSESYDLDAGCARHGVAYVQTPQYYANAGTNRIAEASWSQQSLFFGPIARGKDARGAMFCCGTNVVFRRSALDDVDGFPEGSVTEDFELSIELHERGWCSAYVPKVLASGLGPEDLASYVGQQHRWARGCVGALGRVARSSLPWRLKAQYLLSASYFLTGWTVLVYLSMPVFRILTGAQPIAGTGADGFLAAFAPYFGLALLAVATIGGGAYTYSAYALAASTFWVHVHASTKALFRRPSRFVVTPKTAMSDRQWRAAGPPLAVVGLLLVVVVVGLLRDRDPATLNNVAFALLHIAVLSHGMAAAIVPSTAAITPEPCDASHERPLAPIRA